MLAYQLIYLYLDLALKLKKQVQLTKFFASRFESIYFIYNVFSELFCYLLLKY